MAAYNRPYEPASQVVLERYFLATDFISGIGYGAQAVLYFICSRYLWRQCKAWRYALILAYITLLFLISSVAQLAQAHRVQLIFIENRNFPGGPWTYSEQSVGGAASVVGQSASAALLILSEFFMVWRCWVVWCSVNQHVAYAITLFPFLTLLASIIGVILYFFATVHPASLVAGTHTSAWGTTYYTLVFSTNILVTILILARLVAHRLSVQKSLAPTHVGEHTSLITMLIESSAFYSIIAIGCLITNAVGIPVGNPFVSASISMQQISGYLIIARLANGQAWPTSVSTLSTFAARRQVLTNDSKMGNDGLGLSTDSMSGTVSV